MDVTLQMEAINSLETLVTTKKTTRHHNSEDHTRHLQRHEKFTSRISLCLRIYLYKFTDGNFYTTFAPTSSVV